MIIPELMSSDESGMDEDGKAVISVKEIPWRSDKVGRYFKRLDMVQQQNKSEQAVRQSKARVSQKQLLSAFLPVLVVLFLNGLIMLKHTKTNHPMIPV